MLRVKLLANAGLLLQYDGVTLLLDAIYGSEEHAFSDVPPAVWQKMLQGEPPFEQIDYLLFSHAHPDHFSAEKTLTYLEHRPVKGVFLPESPETFNFSAELTRRGIPCGALSAQYDRAAFRLTPNLSVRAIHTHHLDKRFEDVEHLCYLLKCDEKYVLFTADLDYVTERLEQLKDFPLHGVFINPLFFSVLRRGKFFRGDLQAKYFCIYHVPFAEDDHLDMRRILARDLEQWEKARGQALALTEPEQEIIL